MRKFFLIPLMTLCTCVMAFAGNVSNLAELQAALAAGGDITLTADINAGSTALDVTKGISLIGDGHYVKSTAGYVFNVTTTDAVRFEDVVIYAAKASAGRGILIGVSNANVTLEKVSINAQERGVDVFVSGTLNNVALTINNSTIQHVHADYGISYAADGTPSDPTIFDRTAVSVNGNYSRGVNMGRLTNSTIEINNSAIQGFFYNINNISGTMQNTTVTASYTSFKGRCAFNIWGANGTYVCNDCSVLGLNNWGGEQESFACFVLNSNGGNCNHNTLTINGGTIAGARFNANGSANPNARQFLVRAQDTENHVFVNNCSYSCPKDLGDSKGGVAEYISATCSVIVNDGIYSCPEIVEGVFSNSTSVASLAINGGSYDLNAISSDMTDGDVYRAIALTGGTYNLDMSVVDPGNAESGLIADGYKQVANANGTYSIVPETTEAQSTAVNDVNWNTATDWSTTSQAATVVPDEQTSVTIGNGTEEVSVVVADDGAAEVYRVDMTDKVTLTVKDGGVLTVGDGGIVAHENAAVVVEEGGSLVLNGLIQGTENIVIEASEENSAVVLIAPDVNTYGDEHPVGTFRFTSKSYKNGSKVVHQRFGMPTYNTGIDVKYGTTSSAKTYITNWDYEADDWKHSGDVVEWTEIPSSGSLPLVTVGPFACYDLISNNAKGDEITYEFTGALMGNADGEMKFNRGFNPYANSYTAPIDIESFLNRIASDYVGTDIKPTIYLYKSQANDNYTWASIGLDEFEFGDAEFTEVAPMQAFMLYLGSSTPQIATIDYEGNVYDPFIAKLSSGPSGAPARRVATKKNYLSMTITDADGVEYDRVKFIEDDRFSSAFDNGYDAVKFMKEDVAIYAAADEAQATVASDYVEGMNIGVKVAKSGVYTLTVKYNGLDYALIDTENNTIIELENGKTYNFFAEAGQNDARFQVIKVNKVPTAIDEVEDSQVMSTKFMKEGVLYIIKNGAVYNAQGQIVK